ncbi:hypothetical protein PVE_R2G0530 [Pseudomonas veronii 1YdBTEX2]|uniref:Uncharacterized protein n=2 Tax=Pseudomonas TaxID=286 RepID=A0A1D3K8A1_PSEVE|nr:hypothetical protein A7D21_28545 [Pseudomonas sp. AP19]SBW84556.1 hypothetical protein PVE_R2G0530 [Pseudomonas veronii 1YdBTEX2]
MVDELANHPKDVWTFFNQAKGAINLAKELGLLNAAMSVELTQMATEVRLSISVEPEPVSSENIQQLNEMLAQIKTDSANAWARFRAFEAILEGHLDFYLISSESAEKYLTAGTKARDASIIESPMPETKNA